MAIAVQVQDIRPVAQLIEGEATSDGAGVRLTRLLGHETVQLADRAPLKTPATWSVS